MGTLPLIKLHDYECLKESLYYLKVKELREIVEKLKLSNKGRKKQIIKRILYFIKMGKELVEPQIPVISCAQAGKIYPLSSETLILKGSYKNDLKTRLFFKKLVGDHFHFTAFGIDWLNERWLKGNPPTYQEFADMWIIEKEKRKKNKKSPKKEWAYINFVQNFLKAYPNSSHKVLTSAWNLEREQHKKKAYEILEAVFSMNERF